MPDGAGQQQSARPAVRYTEDMDKRPSTPTSWRGRLLLGWTSVAMTVGLVVTSVVGAVVVYSLATLVVPLPIDPERGLAERNLWLTLTTVPFLVLIGIAAGTRIALPAVRWLRQGREATDAEKRALLALPRRMFVVHAILWASAAVLFALYNAREAALLGLTVLQIVLLAGATTSSIAYLVTERLARPLARRALAAGVPDRIRVRSVWTRIMFAWVLASGVAAAGIAAVGIAALARGDVSARQLAVTMIVLGGVAFVIGGSTTLIAARATSDPIRRLRRAFAKIESGDLDAHVHIDDGTEIGLLQAGFNTMAEGLREREQIRDLFGRHVGDEVARAALAEGVSLGGETRRVAVLFVDVVGSTSLATRRPPTEVVELLNRFFGVVIEVVHEHGGWVNKFEGDAALAVWNAPVEVEAPEAKVLCAARTLQRRLSSEVDGLEAGVGVSAGVAVAGNVGAAERYEYTVIGDPVNEAARLTDEAKRTAGRVVARADLLEQAAGEAEHWEPAGEIVARGRNAPTPIVTVKTSP